MIRYIAGIVMSCALAAAAHAQKLDTATSAKVEAALNIGKELNAHDQSAWHVTDALIATDPQPEDGGVLYVTERLDAKRVKTTFLLIQGEKVSVYFSGVVEGSAVISTEDYTRDLSRPAASEAQISRADALITAREMFPDGLCGGRPNYVVLPAETQGAWNVYAFAPETEVGQVQMGGHVRLTIDANGLVIPGATKSFSNSCLSLNAGGKTEALMITLPENIGDTPTEIHVFKSLSHGIPIYVGTKRGIWAVEGSRIRLVDKKAAN